MKINILLALLLVLAPTVGNAQVLDSLKEGAAKAAKAVDETTENVVDTQRRA